jgi:hypothetical protein
MSSESGDGSVPVSQKRQATIDALMEHFANDALDIDEFERRVGIAHDAGTREELDALLRDLPGGELPVPMESNPSSSPTTWRSSAGTLAHRKEQEVVVALLGGSSRRGRWTPALKNYAVAVMGGAELDFREALLGPGVTEVQVYTLWGGVEIIVPPGIHVESHGIALLGGFEHAASGAREPAPGAPTLRITGVALMAGVEISVRHPGESARDARRRRRQERREQRRRLRGGD